MILIKTQIINYKLLKLMEHCNIILYNSFDYKLS